MLSAVSAGHSGPLQVGCRSGGCGVCRVRIVAGAFRCGGMSRAQVSEAEQAQGVTLACQTFPESDLSFEILGRPAAPGGQGDPASFRRFLALCQSSEPA